MSLNHFVFSSFGTIISIDGRILAQKSPCSLDIWTNNNVVWSLKQNPVLMQTRN